MKKIKGFSHLFAFFILILIILLSSCITPPTPIIIRPIPQIDISSDMTIEAYLYNSTQFGIEITAYTQELINQIRHKTAYIEIKDK